MFPIAENHSLGYANNDFSRIPIQRFVYHKLNFDKQKLILNNEEIKLIEENIQTQLMASQKEILDFYSKTNKKYVAPIDIDNQH